MKVYGSETYTKLVFLCILPKKFEGVTHFQPGVESICLNGRLGNLVNSFEDIDHISCSTGIPNKRAMIWPGRRLRPREKDQSEFTDCMLVRPQRSLDVKLLMSAVFECSRSGNRSIVFGVRLRFGCPIPPFCKIFTAAL